MSSQNLIHQSLLSVCKESDDLIENKDNEINKISKKMIRDFFNDVKKNNFKIVDGAKIYDLKQNYNNSSNNGSSSGGSSGIMPRTNSKEQMETKWEKFAKEKGIKKVKKSRRVFCEESGKWEFKYGSMSVQNQKLKSGIIEVDQSISKMKRDKKKRSEKNKKNMKTNKEQSKL